MTLRGLGYVFTLCSLAALLSVSTPAFAYEAVITQDSVPVRSGAGRAYYPVGELKRGDRVQVETELFGWYQIRCPEGVSSFVERKNVDAKADGTKGVVNTDRTRVYAAHQDVTKAPAESYRPLVDLNRGDLVQIIETIDSYYKIIPPQNTYVFLPPQALAAAEAVAAADPPESDTPADTSSSESSSPETPETPTTPSGTRLAPVVTPDPPAEPTAPATPATEVQDILDPVVEPAVKTPTVEAPEVEPATPAVQVAQPTPPTLKPAEQMTPVTPVVVAPPVSPQTAPQTPSQVTEIVEPATPEEPVAEPAAPIRTTRPPRVATLSPPSDEPAVRPADPTPLLTTIPSKETGPEPGDLLSDPDMQVAKPDVPVSSPAVHPKIVAVEAAMLPYFTLPVDEQPLAHMTRGYATASEIDNLTTEDRTLVQKRLRELERNREMAIALRDAPAKSEASVVEPVDEPAPSAPAVKTATMAPPANEPATEIAAVAPAPDNAPVGIPTGPLVENNTSATEAAATPEPAQEPVVEPVVVAQPEPAEETPAPTPAPTPTPVVGSNFDAVGVLTVSTVHTGQNQPELLRLLDPSGQRTIAYLEPTDAIDTVRMLGQLVGITGSSSYDPRSNCGSSSPTTSLCLAR